MRYHRETYIIQPGINPAIEYTPFKKTNPKKKKSFSFLLWNGEIYRAYAKNIRLAYVLIRDEVNPEDIAFIFPYKPPLPLMLYKNKFVYWQHHPKVFSETLFPFSEKSKQLMESLFNKIRLGSA